MNRLDRVSEDLARHLSRRRLLDRAARSVFVAGLALAVKGLHAPAVFADGCSNYDLANCSCRPPRGVYCASYSSSYCTGSLCNETYCSRDLSGYPNTGCWCTADCTHYDSVTWCGHYRCCDCWCPGAAGNCGCRKSHRLWYGTC